MKPLLRYVGAIIVRPSATWHDVANERMSFANVAFGYVLPLALIGPVATYVARRFVGVHVDHVIYRTSPEAALAAALFAFAFALAGIALVALLVDVFAPLFGAVRSLGKAFVVAAFAWTPVWLASVAVLVPPLGFVQLLAVAYEIFLLHAGLATVLGLSRRRAGFLTAFAMVGTIAIAMAVGGLLRAAAGWG